MRYTDRSSNTFPPGTGVPIGRDKVRYSRTTEGCIPTLLVNFVIRDITSGVYVKLNRYVQLSERIKRTRWGILHSC